MNSLFVFVSDTTVEVLTISEVATILRCSKAHVRNLLSGKVKGAQPLPYISYGRRKGVRRESLVRWMQRSEAEGRVLTSSTCQNSVPTAQESES